MIKRGENTRQSLLGELQLLWNTLKRILSLPQLLKETNKQKLPPHQIYFMSERMSFLPKETAFRISKMLTTIEKKKSSFFSQETHANIVVLVTNFVSWQRWIISPERDSCQPRAYSVESSHSGPSALPTKGDHRAQEGVMCPTLNRRKPPCSGMCAVLTPAPLETS